MSAPFSLHMALLAYVQGRLPKAAMREGFLAGGSKVHLLLGDPSGAGVWRSACDRGPPRTTAMVEGRKPKPAAGRAYDCQWCHRKMMQMGGFSLGLLGPPVPVPEDNDVRREHATAALVRIARMTSIGAVREAMAEPGVLFPEVVLLTRVHAVAVGCILAWDG